LGRHRSQTGCCGQYRAGEGQSQSRHTAAIIVSLRREGYTVETRAQWKAKEPPGSPKRDWDYHGITIHHAGNSFSCEADSAEQLRKAERIDFEKLGHLSYHYVIGCDGLIYEALDIRNKGAHIAVGNAGVIGIVMLADLSVQGGIPGKILAWKDERNFRLGSG
jgi:hypothetical protein